VSEQYGILAIASNNNSGCGLSIADCPTNVVIRPSGGNIAVGTTFICSADAYPTVTIYEWIAANGSSVGNSNFFTLTEEGDYGITCKVANFLSEGTNNPCWNSTHVTGTANVFGMY
jgi:hypothetical protein